MSDAPAARRIRALWRGIGVRGGRAAWGSRSDRETIWLLGLSVLSLLMVVGVSQVTAYWPLTTFGIPIMLGMTALPVRHMLLLYVVIAGCITASLAEIGRLGPLRIGGVITVVIIAVIALFNVLRGGQRLGVASSRGESMLVDLRDRLAAQSRLPALPSGWHAEAVMRSAGGASFSGDFIVAAKTNEGRLLEVVVVDVSGKGVNAGSRALLLSGAFGGLLGSLARDRFLPGANGYLLRQEWGEGFATAAHVALDLTSGQFEVRTAGHPPAVQFHAGAGRWSVLWTEGPILGLVEGASYSVHHGKLSSGDVLLMYTDGLVETPTLDITHGIDRLVGEAERLVQTDFVDGATRLVASAVAKSDDRALLMLHRL